MDIQQAFGLSKEFLELSAENFTKEQVQKL